MDIVPRTDTYQTEKDSADIFSRTDTYQTEQKDSADIVPRTDIGLNRMIVRT